MLIPKKVKHRKWHKGRNKGKGRATSINELDYGMYGLKSLENKWLGSRELEAARIAMTRFIKRGGKIWIRVFPDKPVTAKGTQSTMGSGKGALDHYVVVVKPGTVLFEIDGVDLETAKEAMRLASHKVSVKTKFLSKQ
ncbi:50S ribosomal protein L16 [Candidatus Parcubacteria bacterium]|nr:MAG: 50S ribosomal protein L16 [Candidatus Parcubacteria bacterium]